MLWCSLHLEKVFQISRDILDYDGERDAYKVCKLKKTRKLCSGELKSIYFFCTSILYRIVWHFIPLGQVVLNWSTHLFFLRIYHLIYWIYCRPTCLIQNHDCLAPLFPNSLQPPTNRIFTMYLSIILPVCSNWETVLCHHIKDTEDHVYLYISETNYKSPKKLTLSFRKLKR